MKMMNRITRRMLNKAVTMTGAAFLTLLTTAAVPSMAQSATPASQPSAASANRLIAEGVGQDGRVRLTVNKSIVLTTTKPYKQVSVGQPDIADVNMISPN